MTPNCFVIRNTFSLFHLSELIHKLKPAYLYSLLRYFTYRQSGFDIRVGGLGKTETEFRIARQNLNTLVSLPIKKTIYRDKIQGPSSNYRDRNLAYVEPCRQDGYQQVFVW